MTEKKESGAPEVWRVARENLGEPADRAFLALSVDTGPLASLVPAPPGDPDSFARRLEALRERPGLSESLAVTLTEFNRNLGAEDLALSNLGRLARGEAAAVIAFSPPFPSGGPASILFKAATASALCRALSSKGVGAFVPVFIVDAGPPGTSAPPSALRAPEEEEGIGNRVDGLLEEAASLPPEAAFGRLLHGLLPGLGLVLAALRFFRPEGLSLFEQELLDPEGIASLLRRAGEALAREGVAVPFDASPATNLCFEEAVGRPRPVTFEQDRFLLDGREVEPFDLLSGLDRLSPAPSLQPLLACMALPVATVVADPEEAASCLQRGPLYAYFGLTRPVVFPRLTATLVEDRAGAPQPTAGLRETSDPWVHLISRHGPLLSERLLASADVFDFRHHVFRLA